MQNEAFNANEFFYNRVSIDRQIARRTDKLVPADYDGDNKTDVAVFRPSNGTWYIRRSTSGFAAVPFGVSTDKAVPNAYVR